MIMAQDGLHLDLKGLLHLKSKELTLDLMNLQENEEAKNLRSPKAMRLEETSLELQKARNELYKKTNSKTFFYKK